MTNYYLLIPQEAEHKKRFTGLLQALQEAGYIRIS